MEAPLVHERLALSAANGRVKSVRMTEGEPSEVVNVPLPTADELTDYVAALATCARLRGVPDAATRQRLRAKVKPLQASLLRIIPAALRLRLAEAGSPTALELTLTDAPLEAYPWELIGGACARSGGQAPITVWRSIVSPEPPVPKHWTNSILLAGSAPMSLVPPFIHEEFEWIERDLREFEAVELHPYPQVKADFGHLLTRHRPVALHLVAHATSEGVQFQAEQGATLDELDIDPQIIGAELGRSDVSVAVFNCCDSASVPRSGGRPAAYEIASRSGAAAIGMAGLLQPYVGALFASTFYRRLAGGASVLQAYRQGVESVRAHERFSTMWSIPVMYSRASNVVPFPAGDEARARLRLAHIRGHMGALDGELAGLASRRCTSAGEWAQAAGTPAVRIGCIKSYLGGLAGARAGTTREVIRHRRYLERATDELESALSGTAETLEALGSPHSGAGERRVALAGLDTDRRRHERLLRRLDALFEDVG